jgi:hypothetical protein
VLADGINQTPIHSLFHLPLSQQAHGQMVQLQWDLENLQLDNTHDKWSYIWNSGNFSVKKAYQCISGQSILHPVYKWLWQCSCQNKHKVFFWLLIKARLSTRELLRRHYQISTVLCNGSIEESLIHLFFDCPFATQCWAWINVQVDQSADPIQNLDNFKVQLQVPFFMEIIVLMSWTIWKIRNDMIFRQENPSFQATKDFFKSELRYLLLRVRRKFIPGFTQWIANLA